ncbi:hypothetical protein RJT34_24764 [Clitoria ternatea]|uniref:Uncharacterized protein n=1 Tax=Clitoria ternatea TaxID=43366 RepID=A0AAN9FNH2_CLITE
MRLTKYASAVFNRNRCKAKLLGNWDFAYLSIHFTTHVSFLITIFSFSFFLSLRNGVFRLLDFEHPESL